MFSDVTLRHDFEEFLAYKVLYHVITRDDASLFSTLVEFAPYINHPFVNSLWDLV
jgi:hypothetical protein